MISIIIISKDEPSLDATLTHVSLQARALEENSELIVVDASQGRLDDIRLCHQGAVRWIDFQQPVGVDVSIPHQRNVGVRAAHGGVIVFTDAGCRPDSDWLARLVAPLLEDEHVASGLTLAMNESSGLYDRPTPVCQGAGYLKECSTINLAFLREVYEAVGGFDEEFAYGSDVDFVWRLIDVGYRVRSVPDAVIRHDWGSRQRQRRRSYVYGKARMRLYRKHRVRLRNVLHDDPMVVVYPAFLVGLPLTLVFPLYPALLLIPIWRNRSRKPIRAISDHLIYGLGVLAELVLR